jgi:kynureninase
MQPVWFLSRLVDCRNVAAALDVGDDLNAITHKHGNSIVLRSFQLIQAKWVPYEFDFTKPSEQPQFNAQVSQKFLSELSTLLCDLGMDQLALAHRQVQNTHCFS